MFFTIQNFSKCSFSLSLSSTDPYSKQFFLLFSLNFSQRFLSSSFGKTILPFLFQFFFFFLHAFKGEFQTYRNLGFLVFSMISFKIDQ